jgi:site-specific recombinase XerD
MQKNDRLAKQIQDYIDYLDVLPQTKQGYHRILAGYCDHISRITSSPTRLDILDYKEQLKKRLKASSVQKHIVVIRNFYRWFHIEGYGSNIVEGVKGSKIVSDFKREALTEEQAKRLITRARFLSQRGIKEQRDYAIIALLLTTGLRTIEIERSNIADINAVDGRPLLYVMGKGHDDKDSFVKLAPQVYLIIQDYLVARSDGFEPLFICHNSQNLGERIQTRSIRMIVKELLRQIGIDNPKYSAHSLRHTAATLSLQQGASIEDTQQLLRHKDPATTQIYIHRIDKMKGDLESKISNVLFGTTKQKKG